MFSRRKMRDSMSSYLDKIVKIKEKIEQAEALIIGAGAGLSTSAGFAYRGRRFDAYFSDMEKAYGFRDMYSGSFYKYASLEEKWGFWSRCIYVNRYMDAPKPVYSDLFELVKDKNYFVLTTNVDHCFQKAGFDKKRLFYTQGDYGLFQCSKPCHCETYDNEEIIKEMLIREGFEIKDGVLVKPEGLPVKLDIPSELIPKCPRCGRPMSMNLRADSTFVQDKGWDEAAERYERFLADSREKKVVFMELGVGYNTPRIIKYPFWQYTYHWKDAFYVCINKGQADIPSEIRDKAISVDADISEVMADMKRSVIG